MDDLIPFAFEEELVRCVVRDGDPWFVGRDVCKAMQLAKPENALHSLDEDERGTCSMGTPGGEQRMIIISEPGVYRLVFRSRKPAAERFKRWLAHEVLPALRRTGRYGVADEAPAPLRGLEPQSYRERLDTVAEARLIGGPEVARTLWIRLGLPALPPPPPTPLDEARACLDHLLGAELAGRAVRVLIEDAIEDEEDARALLLANGLRVEAAREGVVVANRHLELETVFRGTSWTYGRWTRVLRRLSGTEAVGPTRFSGAQRRGTFLPALYLDRLA